MSKHELLQKFNRGEVCTDEELLELRNTLHAFEKYTTTNSYFGNLPDFDLDLIIHGARMYLYSVNSVISARKIK